MFFFSPFARNLITKLWANRMLKKCRKYPVPCGLGYNLILKVYFYHIDLLFLLIFPFITSTHCFILFCVGFSFELAIHNNLGWPIFSCTSCLSIYPHLVFFSLPMVYCNLTWSFLYPWKAPPMFFQRWLVSQSLQSLWGVAHKLFSSEIWRIFVMPFLTFYGCYKSPE